MKISNRGLAMIASHHGLEIPSGKARGPAVMDGFRELRQSVSPNVDAVNEALKEPIRRKEVDQHHFDAIVALDYAMGGKGVMTRVVRRMVNPNSGKGTPEEAFDLNFRADGMMSQKIARHLKVVYQGNYDLALGISLGENGRITVGELLKIVGEKVRLGEKIRSFF